ncbi:unnamed protein product, partial [Ectocarpus sp. 8 AP-2014]
MYFSKLAGHENTLVFKFCVKVFVLMYFSKLAGHENTLVFKLSLWFLMLWRWRWWFDFFCSLLFSQAVYKVAVDTPALSLYIPVPLFPLFDLVCSSLLFPTHTPAPSSIRPRKRKKGGNSTPPVNVYPALHRWNCGRYCRRERRPSDSARTKA